MVEPLGTQKARHPSRRIHVGGVAVGGGAPVSVQSMTKTDTRDSAATLAQIERLAVAGCEIVRCAVPDEEAAAALGAICANSSLPLIADIHFDHRLALRALDAGVDGLRLNPGNIGARWKVEEVVRACRERAVPIRIGVNGGSLERELLERYGHPTPAAMVESALGHIRLLEDLGFDAIKVSLKASDIRRTVEAYRLLARQVDYPLHIGITEAGTTWSGTVKSAVGLGVLLYEGLGDTLRVSLTGDPVEEVRVGWEILKSLGLRERGPVFVSCPTCGRCQVDLIAVAEEVERRLHDLPQTLTVAVMGCVVNGPGEAREADVGLAGGKGQALLFRKGEVVRKVAESEMVEALIAEVHALLNEQGRQDH
ncbi:4-hydroxy-3-methylbut-2-en-1-yl diphosphate synthase [Geoalkalibacter ferrihydriticus]|uniref:4-hydroxy-3-methylbut-2-en-1-yl diphosphate synthase (flavodoxin) n=2 Tax=Geoalkalibacter ferrihydriticus TaxID=392333 RepID=A0A0C2DQA3_9BACT|nr:flavodoxin-dependent (E)-4-hydroxy-3-methylbut-2-enyl-diphosphate synthase [Geoalkalibacter ferrihydriticus]KIH75569.1 4-hydroxy-3-methylbut-2-en-1-yl diphosphate synthase [Geoalkalibacter ferrihydriticus DSM 17813]SDL31608.1 4-hydroxy-3-methylbut-2-en-1-yl diphosphate synthase [Geoalkalibacter ferrihydriticus]